MFEVSVQIWQDDEDSPVYYSIIQDINNDDGETVEPLAYGQVDTFDQAAGVIGDELKMLF